MAVTPTSVLGKYRIIREIARSNDIVYEGVDPAMGRRVAIKELALPQHLAGSQKRERIERFYREAKAAGTLTHPNIVTIYDVGEENERHFIVMEYLEGHSLREIQQMQGALPLKESLEIALQLCDALGYAHSRGIVHRDVKPDNVHILPGGIIKLTDFGIARITAEPSITAHGQVFGTPSYMSPEQVASHTVDHRTDIFSLGITLYEMLTGRKPFQGDSVITITYNIMNIQPPMPVGVPPGLHAILQKALAKDVNARYQNTGQMAADLRAEKFILESGNRTAQMQPPSTQQQMPHGHTLNTGNVPPEVSGIPAFTNPQHYGQPQYPPQQQPQQYRPPAPPQYPQHQQPHPPQYQQNQPPQYGQQGGYQPPQYGAPQFPQGQQRPQSGNRPMNQEAKQTVKVVAITLLIVLLLVLLVSAFSMAWRRYDMVTHQEYAMKLYEDGHASLSNHDYDGAATSFDSAISIAPGTLAAIQSEKGLSLVALAHGIDAASHNNPTSAEDFYNKALQYDPTNAEAWEDLGNLKSDEGQQENAIQDWKNAIANNPGGTFAADGRRYSAIADIALANNARQSGDLDKARSYLTDAEQVDPGSDEATRAASALANMTASSH